MLPCNIIVQEKIAGQIEVSAINPATSMMLIKNLELQDLAMEIGAKLQKVIEKL